MSQRPHIFDLTLDELQQQMSDWGLPTYRAEQLLQWVYHQQVADLQQMTNLAKADRDLLTEHLLLSSGRVVAHQQASDGVQKLLLDFGAEESRQVECVMIPVEKRRTAWLG